MIKQMIRAILVACVLAAISGAGHAEPPEVRARRTKRPPKVDGKLDDACWRRAEGMTSFVTPAGPAAEVQTKAYVLYDDEALYVAFLCQEPQTDSLQPGEKGPFTWRDDNVALFLRPDKDRYYQLAVNCRGVKLTQRNNLAPGRKEVRGFEMDWRAEASVGENAWSVETAIPFKSLDEHAQAGRPWRVNFCRLRSRSGEASDWSNVGKRWHTWPMFGYLTGILVGGEYSREDVPFRLRDLELPRTSELGNNLLTLAVRSSGKSEALAVRLASVAPSGKAASVDQTFELQGRGTKTVTVPYPLGTELGEHTLNIRFLSKPGGDAYYSAPPVRVRVYEDRIGQAQKWMVSSLPYGDQDLSAKKVLYLPELNRLTADVDKERDYARKEQIIKERIEKYPGLYDAFPGRISIMLYRVYKVTKEHEKGIKVLWEGRNHPNTAPIYVRNQCVHYLIDAYNSAGRPYEAIRSGMYSIGESDAYSTEVSAHFVSEDRRWTMQAMDRAGLLDHGLKLVGDMVAIGTCDTCPQYALLYGTRFHVKKKDYRRAVETFRLLSRRTPVLRLSGMSIREANQARYWAAEAHYQLKEYEEALKLYRLCVATNADYITDPGHRDFDKEARSRIAELEKLPGKH